MPDFTTMDIATLTRNVTGEGVRYLELFLKEYTSMFGKSVNPSCPACLNKYLTKYKNHFKAMANTSLYRLHAKYENIPLEFGSPILVNNANMTNEYAQILLQRPGGESLFALLPEDDAEVFGLNSTVITPPSPAPIIIEEEIEGEDDHDILNSTRV
jgi:hypothetical protein